MEIASFHKLFGKAFIKALLLGLLPAVHPFYKAADLRAEPALAGSYGPEGPTDPILPGAERETLTVAASRTSSRDYAVSIKNAEGTLEFDGRLFQLSGAAPAYFLDLAPRKDKARRFAATMNHLAAKLVLRADGLELFFLRPDLIADSGLEAAISPERRKECREDPDALYSAGEFCSRVLAAPTKDLQGLLKSGLEKALFVDPVRLYRIGPPRPPKG